MSVRDIAGYRNIDTHFVLGRTLLHNFQLHRELTGCFGGGDPLRLLAVAVDSPVYDSGIIDELARKSIINRLQHCIGLFRQHNAAEHGKSTQSNQ